MATDLQPGALGGALAEKPKVFGLFSMVLFSVSAILVADTVASSAELGSAWPDEGGIYVWGKIAGTHKPAARNQTTDQNRRSATTSGGADVIDITTARRAAAE